jgi:alkyl hydroperoxide reductase subunit D
MLLVQHASHQAWYYQVICAWKNQGLEMSILKIARRLPEYAEDIRKNLSELFLNPLDDLVQHQVYGIALTAGYFLLEEQMLTCIRAEAKLYLEEEDADACKEAVVIMEMNNCYYGFVDGASTDEYKKMSPELSMDCMSEPKVKKEDFELYCFAVAVLAGNQYNIKLHLNRLHNQGVSKAGIRNAVRICAVLKAAAQAFRLESARSYDFVARGESL